MGSTIETVMREEVSESDRLLLAQVRDGDPQAREALARRVGDSAYVFALQLTGGSQSSRDIAQDSVLRFFEHLSSLDSERPLEPWLYQIVRNRVRDLSRRDRLRRHESLDLWLEQGRSVGADPTADPAADAERDELRRRVWRAISQLTVTHREIIVLRDYHDLTYREIADTLAIPQGTVMSRLHSARRCLREIIVADDGNFSSRAPARRGDQ
jgi:RNA polymerase sigma-70 factor (ECF subfamily)